MERRTEWLPPSPAPASAAGAQDAPLGAPERPAPAPDPPGSPLRRALGVLVVLGAAGLKFGKVALLFVGKAKLLTTAASMVLSVGAYALIWGLPFALGFVGLLFVHEMGHYVALRREGVRPSGMLFIPFLGAVVGARSLGGDALAEARVGLAGPIVGSLGCVALLPVAAATGNELWQALAFTGFFLNLFNLVPLLPFDGGRAMAAMAPWMWWVGFAGMVALLVVAPNPVLILFVLLGGLETWRRWRTRGEGEEGNAAYYAVAPRHRLAVGAVYLGLVVALAVGMDLTFLDRSDSL